MPEVLTMPVTAPNAARQFKFSVFPRTMPCSLTSPDGSGQGRRRGLVRIPDDRYLSGLNTDQARTRLARSSSDRRLLFDI